MSNSNPTSSASGGDQKPKSIISDGKTVMNPQVQVESIRMEPSVKSPVSLPDNSIKDTTSVKSISFQIPKSENVVNHRLSISCVPKKDRPKIIDSILTDDNAKDEDVEEINCTVHMPGDFVYLPSTSDNQLIDDSSSSNKAVDMDEQQEVECKKIIFKKQVTTIESEIPFTDFFQNEDDKKIHILLGATGSVATIKIPLIIDKLFKVYTPAKVSIQLIVTKPAEHFLDGLKISSQVKIWKEEDAIADTNNDTMLFHELRRWADIFIIAPLSANSLAKLANGICNNLITSVFRDWTSNNAPVLVAPAMNTFMYINPMTKRHFIALKESFPFVEILKPVEKVLICGDIGMGGMREWADIVEIIRQHIKEIHRLRKENTEDKEDKEDIESRMALGDTDDDDDDDDDDNDDNDDNDDDDDDDDEDDDEEDEDDDSSVLDQHIPPETTHSNEI